MIWYNGTNCFIFVDDGVCKMAQDFQDNEFKIFVWTLIDSDQAPHGVPLHLVQNRTRVNYASPNKQRWKRLHKNVEDVTVMMNPWSWREIL